MNLKNFMMVILLSFILLGNLSNLKAMTSNIVNPNQVYTYEILTQDIKKIATAYPDLIQYMSIGTTVYGREIWAVRLGKGEATITLNGVHHAREWLTTNLLMNMIEYYAKGYQEGKDLEGYKVKDILDKITIWFIPMVNPDGVTLQQKGLDAFPDEGHEALLGLNNNSQNFNSWKTNAQGIDLNR